MLLTEDCPDQGRLYLGFLQMAGAEVTLECSGRSAVDVVRKTPTLFDVIIMDFQMPEIDDIESTRQICELGYEGPIIAMTAFGSDELKQSWFQAGCNEYLEIPLKKSELIVAVLHHMKA
ncbi:response regulator [Gimesia sp.]|uniref:response regulator n=1 Tax=Gimesia sp. TaxID=2024833 RepID=UPI0025BBBD0A|nr:response regulator [Gimesia sp.]